MTNEEMLDAFLKPRGMTRTGGCDLSLLAPFFLLDLSLTIYTNVSLEGVDDTGMKLRQEWLRAYTEVNGPFFMSYKGKLEDAMIDKMDRFEKFMENDLVMLQATIWRHLQRIEPYRSSLEQNRAADCLLAELLVMTAGKRGTIIVDTTRTRMVGIRVVIQKLPKKFTDSYKGIEDIQNAINEFNNYIYKPVEDIQVCDSPELGPAFDQMLMHLNQFIYRDAYENYHGLKEE